MNDFGTSDLIYIIHCTGSQKLWEGTEFELNKVFTQEEKGVKFLRGLEFRVLKHAVLMCGALNFDFEDKMIFCKK